MDGANNSTTFTDLSSNARSVTRSGSSVVVSTDQSKFGGSSAFFSGSYLSLDNADGKLTMAGDFTVELWIRRTDTTWAGVVGNPSSGTNHQFIVNGDYGSGSAGKLGLYIDSPIGASDAGALAQDDWKFLSYTRSGSTIWTHLGGALLFSGSSSASIVFNGIGGTAYRSNFRGYIDEVRITKGVARYGSGSYTVPSGAFPAR
jgi:hypothetical protein